MTQPVDPKRWKDAAGEAPPQFQSYVAADEAHGPDAGALARMMRGVATELGRPELQAAFEHRAAMQSAVAGAAPTAFKLGAGLLAIVICAGAYWTLRPTPASRRPQSAVVVEQVPARADRAESKAQERAEPLATVPVPPEPIAEARAAPPVPHATAPASSAAVRTRRAVDPTPADPAAELALLERAQRALATDARAALALADQHRRDYAHGTFEQEREVLAIDALLRVGERAAAERRARAFVRAFPASSHRPRVEDLLRSVP